MLQHNLLSNILGCIPTPGTFRCCENKLKLQNVPCLLHSVVAECIDVTVDAIGDKFSPLDIDLAIDMIGDR